MGTRGPVPNRSDQRRRRNKPETPLTVAPSPPAVSVPPADEGWHPMAADWYRSLADSGQSVFYQPSDWQTARVWAEVLSRQLCSGGKMSAQMIAAWSTSATELLTTEGARRRARLELDRRQRDADEERSLAAVHDIQRLLGG